MTYGSMTQTASEERVRDAYGFCLLIVVGSIFVSIAVPDLSRGALVAGLFQFVALMTALVVTRASKRAIWTARVAGITAAGLASVITVMPSSPFAPLVPVLWAGIVLGAIVAILRHLQRYKTITLQVVLGLLTVYLLLGLLFAYLFMLTQALGVQFFVSGESQSASFVYFSYVTLATVGYGDLQAAVGIPRAFAVLEAVLGQLYLVTVVAMAVSRMGRDRRDQTAE